MDRKVAYFIGCVANYNDPGIAKAALKVLRHNGFSVFIPDQMCCGLPHLVSGNLKSARSLARCNMRHFLRANCDVVTACTSCALALKFEYRRLLGTEESDLLAQRTYDISEYLMQLHDLGHMKTDFHALKFSGLYHAPCHLKLQGQDLIERRLRLMQLIPGLRVEQADRGCCGMAGAFGLKSVNYTVSMEIGRSLFQTIKDKKPDGVITDCPSCKLQIAHGSGFEVSHPVELWERAYSL